MDARDLEENSGLSSQSRGVYNGPVDKREKLYRLRVGETRGHEVSEVRDRRAQGRHSASQKQRVVIFRNVKRPTCSTVWH